LSLGPGFSTTSVRFAFAGASHRATRPPNATRIQPDVRLNRWRSAIREKEPVRAISAPIGHVRLLPTSFAQTGRETNRRRWTKPAGFHQRRPNPRTSRRNLQVARLQSNGSRDVKTPGGNDECASEEEIRESIPTQEGQIEAGSAARLRRSGVRRRLESPREMWARTARTNIRSRRPATFSGPCRLRHPPLLRRDMDALRYPPLRFAAG